MALVASVDYPGKRIILGIDSVGVDVLPVDIYKEMRARRRLNADNDRRFLPMITAFGNEAAGPSNTPRFTDLAAGVRIIPFDSSHQLLIRGALISRADGLAGRDLFDRTTLSVGVEVDVDYQPQATEIITVNTGSAVLPSDVTDIRNAIFNFVMEDAETFAECVRLMRAEAAGSITRTGNTHYIKSADGLTDRIVADADATGRTVSSTDGS